MPVIITIIIIFILAYLASQALAKRKWKTPKQKLNSTQIKILEETVPFYNRLNSEKKAHFEYEIQEFLLNYKITPVSTTISETEKILIAASGVIPIFAFPDWKYVNLKEILVYPDTFAIDFRVEGKGRNILGMVGTGTYSYKMFLSKRAIINGFASDKDGHNTAIHEFIHLIDGADGKIDGLPEVLLEQPYVMPWLDLIHQEIGKIRMDASELRPYGGTNNSEFFAVASEFFLERPELLEKEHPLLHQYLSKMFEVNK